LLHFGITIVQAQQATTATGGDASGSGGTAAYSMRQVVYITYSDTNGSVRQDLKVAYEILTVGIAELNFNISLQAYPNPTTDYLTLNLGEAELSKLNFQLLDINGKVVASKKITSTTETIRMENLASATCFFKVVNNNQTVKTFKIIKN
jgi:hypothetical protein